MEWGSLGTGEVAPTRSESPETLVWGVCGVGGNGCWFLGNES